MVPINVKEIIKATSGKLISGSSEEIIKGVSIDSRTIKRGELFIPLKGENYDGHLFLKEALRKGAKGFLYQRDVEKKRYNLETFLKPEILAIEVGDTLQAFQRISRLVREKTKAKVIGITGSSGKTSTKDILSSILSLKFQVVSAFKNYNNEFGLPLTLIQADEKTEVIVLEMAMRGLAQIKELCKIALPDVGIVTNVGVTHYELLGSVEKIAQAKAELVEFIPQDGVVVLNYDDPWTKNFEKKARGKILTFGFDKKATFFADKVGMDSFYRPSFRLNSPMGSLMIKISIPGKQQIYNCLAASAASFWLGVTLEEIKVGLESARLSEMRMEMKKTSKGIIIFNDAYNANPDSVKEALTVLKGMEKGKRKIAVLGDMLELGEISKRAHYEIGKVVAELSPDILITVGERAKGIAEGAKENGYNSGKVFVCQDNLSASKLLKKVLNCGDIILLKASRLMKFEEIAQSIGGD